MSADPPAIGLAAVSADPPAIGLAAVRFAYPGGAPVLTAADLSLPRGARLALLGANGSGKTTALRCLSGAVRPAAGTVSLGGQPIRYSASGLRRHRAAVQLVRQDPDDQLFAASVFQDVSFGPLNLGLAEPEVRQRVAEALELLAIGGLRDRPTHLLSLGERKRVAIAGAVAMRPRVLLLDEPTAGLDPAGVAETLEALERLRARGTAVVLSTHDVDLALSWADLAAVVVDGRIRQGRPGEILRDGELLGRARLRPPGLVRIAQRLAELGLLVPGADPRSTEELLDSLRHQPTGKGIVN